MTKTDMQAQHDNIQTFLIDRDLLRSSVRILTSTLLVLLGFGILMVASASFVRAIGLNCPPYYFLQRQIIWLLAGLVLMFVAINTDYHVWTRYAWPIFGAAVLMLVAVLLIGHRVGGCTRWLNFGFVRFQPSEFAKFASIILLSYWLDKHRERMREPIVGFLVPVASISVILLLILKEPDLGTTVLVALILWAMLFVGGSPRNWLVIGGLLGMLVVLVYLVLDEHRWLRVIAVVFPDLCPDTARQVIESQNAFKAGGFSINPGGSIGKHCYLPEVHTDFIFAVIGEELGIWGSFAVVCIFAVVFLTGLVISLNAPDMSGRNIAFGITFSIVAQALFNMYVVTGLLPTKGIALPGFSYGGSSLVVFMLQAGVLLNVGRTALRRQRRVQITPG